MWGRRSRYAASLTSSATHPWPDAARIYSTPTIAMYRSEALPGPCIACPDNPATRNCPEDGDLIFLTTLPSWLHCDTVDRFISKDRSSPNPKPQLRIWWNNSAGHWRYTRAWERHLELKATTPT